MHLLALLLQSEPDQEVIRNMVIAMMAILPLILLIGIAILVVPFWFICKKAGMSPWLSLLNMLPLGSLVLIYILAFANWNVVPAPQQGWPPQPPYPQPPQG